jgi:hypothetical protein
MSTAPSYPVLNAHQLRMLAEFASSQRKVGGDPFYGVAVPDPDVMGPEFKLEIVSTLAEGQVPLFEIDTFEVEARPKPTEVTFKVDGMTMANMAHEYDAVFWSESAVEKFVFPYYASKSLWETAAVLEKLSMYWYGQIPPDTDVGEGESVFARFLVEPPFAIAHTPDSDYRSLESDLHLLVRDGDRVRAHRLSDLPHPRHPRHPRARDERADRGQRTLAATAAA